jgi:hypothetical protein
LSHGDGGIEEQASWAAARPGKQAALLVDERPPASKQAAVGAVIRRLS